MDRRRAARRSPATDEPLSRGRLRAGRELRVIDASNSGVLIEGTARLLPGTHVGLHLVTSEGRTLVRSRVVRAYVSELRADLVLYRGALAFDRLVDTAPLGNGLPSPHTGNIDRLGTAYPDEPGSHAPATFSA